MKRFRSWVVFGMLAFSFDIAEAPALNLTHDDDVTSLQVVTLIYDPDDGNLSVDVGGERLTTLEIISAERNLSPPDLNPGVCPPLIDCIHDAKFFVLNTTGFDAIDIGPILPGGLTANELVADLTADGSFLGGGGLDKFVASSPHLYVYVVPEPDAILLIVLGVLVLWQARSVTHEHTTAFPR